MAQLKVKEQEFEKAKKELKAKVEKSEEALVEFKN